MNEEKTYILVGGSHAGEFYTLKHPHLSLLKKIEYKATVYSELETNVKAMNDIETYVPITFYTSTKTFVVLGLLGMTCEEAIAELIANYRPRK